MRGREGGWPMRKRMATGQPFVGEDAVLSGFCKGSIVLDPAYVPGL